MFYNARLQQGVSSIDTNHHRDFFNALFQSIEKMNYILVVGPGATQSNGEQPRLYWHTLFAAIISWCVESGIIETPQRENELRQLLSKRDALFSLGYVLEEYLSDKAEIQRCLKDVLQHIAHSSNLQQHQIHLPFRGFISTTYDITIETEYEWKKRTPQSRGL